VRSTTTPVGGARVRRARRLAERRATGGLGVLVEPLQQPQERVAAAQRAELRAALAAAERAHRDAVAGREAHVGQRGAHLLRVGELGRPREVGRGARAHGRALVDEHVEREVLLLDVQLEEQRLEPRVGVPVDAPRVVARRVAAVVGELDRLAVALAAPLAGSDAAQCAAGDDREALEAAQEGGVEGHRHVVRTKGSTIVRRYSSHGGTEEARRSLSSILSVFSLRALRGSV
jgi:hypothetical protein